MKPPRQITIVVSTPPSGIVIIVADEGISTPPVGGQVDPTFPLPCTVKTVTSSGSITTITKSLPKEVKVSGSSRVADVKSAKTMVDPPVEDGDAEGLEDGDALANATGDFVGLWVGLIDGRGGKLVKTS